MRKQSTQATGFGRSRGSAGIVRIAKDIAARKALQQPNGCSREAFALDLKSGSPRSQWTQVLFDLAKSGIPQF